MDDTTQVTDRAHLTSRTYATDEALSVRINTHKLYTRPPMDFHEWVLDHLPWRGDEQVLDIGCGAGAYVEPLVKRLNQGGHLVAGDLSLGMLRDTVAGARYPQVAFFCADVMHLPLASRRFDVVLANHMLYHVPDIERAVGEMGRVLRPGGYLLAATNSRDSMQRFLDEIELACAVLGHPAVIPESPARTRFNLENGAGLLRPHFPAVHVHHSTSSLIFPTPEPAVAYINSMRDFYEHLLPSTVGWEQVMMQIGRHVEHLIAELGSYCVNKTSGLFLARCDQ